MIGRAAAIALIAGCAHHPASPPAYDTGADDPAARPGDKDGDGIPDRDDLCPFQPEDKDGFVDDDGCPDSDCDDCCAAFAHTSIQFFPNRTTIAAVEFPLVANAALEINARPELRLIELESWGPLAELRMTAVRDALIKLGVAHGRLRFRTEQHRVPPPRYLYTGVGLDVAEGACTTRIDVNDES